MGWYIITDCDGYRLEKFVWLEEHGNAVSLLPHLYLLALVDVEPVCKLPGYDELEYSVYPAVVAPCHGFAQSHLHVVLICLGLCHCVDLRGMLGDVHPVASRQFHPVADVLRDAEVELVKVSARRPEAQLSCCFYLAFLHLYCVDVADSHGSHSKAEWNKRQAGTRRRPCGGRRPFLRPACMAVVPRPSSPTPYLANGAICRTVFGAKSPVSARFWAKCGLDHFLANVWASGRFTHAWRDRRCVYGHGIGAASGSVRRRPACRTACQKTRPAGAAKCHDAAMANGVGSEPAVGHRADMASLYEHACSGLADQIHAVNRMGATVPVAVHSEVWRKSSWQNFV